MTTYNIYPIPYEVRGLEYLNLLHKHTSGISLNGDVFSINRFSWKLLFLPKHKVEKRIVHVHWETNIYGSKYAILSIWRILYRFGGFFLLKLRGVKFVWTRHNLKAHDYPHPWVDALGRSIMKRLADVAIIQEEEVARQEQVQSDFLRIVCIPQGNYIGIYGPIWQGDRSELRRRLGIGEKETVLLALGSIRPYKALPQLIEAFKRARRDGAFVHLLIAGKTSEDYKKVISAAAGGDDGITLRLEFVPDEKIPEILALADYTVFYYGDSSLSSAAMILSLSYGTPVITRDIPASKMIIEGQNGFIFKSSDDLYNLLMSFGSRPKFDKDSVIKTVEGQTWPVVASKLRETYTQL